jgi:hypothetical protein
VICRRFTRRYLGAVQWLSRGATTTGDVVAQSIETPSLLVDLPAGSV